MAVGLDEVLDAVADPTRRAILQRLAHGPATTGQLAGLLPMSRPAVSKHLRQLQNAELVQAATVGRHRWQTLDLAGLELVERWVHRLRKVAADAPALRQPGSPTTRSPSSRSPSSRSPSSRSSNPRSSSPRSSPGGSS